MKRIHILGILCTIVVSVSATPVSPSLAQQIAENFLNAPQIDSLGMAKAPVRKKQVKKITTATTFEPYLYIFNATDEDGFIIVSGNDCATPILGYSLEGCIDPCNLPIQLQELLSAYLEEIKYAEDNSLSVTESVQCLWNDYSSTSNIKKVATARTPLISTKWNQSPYYNNKCPVDASLSRLGGHPTTGCVATAMAQIMKYWAYPTKGSGNKSYKSEKYGTLSANFSITTYDWANMPLTLSSSSSSTQVNAIATLMYHCGVAVSMNYNRDGNGSSGAYVIDYGSGRASAEVALKNYFGYASTVVGKTWGSSVSVSTWKQMLKNELDNKRPVLYAGSSSMGGGHAFVCDGYDSKDLFHFNWGWGGSADGYFSLTALTPVSSNYSDGQQAVIGIQPKDGTKPAKNYDLYMNTDLTCTNTSESNTFTYGRDLSFSAKVENNGTGIFNGTLKVAIFDNAGEFIAWSKESYHFSLAAGQRTVQETYTFDGGIPFISGQYHAYMYYQDDDETDYKLVKTDEGIILTEYNNVTFMVVVSGDLKPVSSFRLERGAYTVGNTVRIEVDVLNTAFLSTFYGKIKLCLYDLDGTYMQTIDELDYTGGFSVRSTKTLSFIGIIDVEPGTYYLTLSCWDYNESYWYLMGCNSSYPSSVRVNITAPPLYADDFEKNNTQSTATPLKWSIEQEMEDFTTLQVSLHEDSDIDYYKLSFPNSNKYQVNIFVYDKYNQGGQWYENADVQFAYSIGGTTYSDFLKNNKVITFNGPTTLYIKVTQYGLNGLGYYELSGDIEETPTSDVGTIKKDSILSKILLNGHLYILRDDNLFTATGAKVK